MVVATPVVGKKVTIAPVAPLPRTAGTPFRLPTMSVAYSNPGLNHCSDEKP